uniref:SAP domain-containing protein n=1 Tax=viral metagenome TaxID=1070528 RepID=A0A6C0DV36_9ZZZZ
MDLFNTYLTMQSNLEDLSSNKCCLISGEELVSNYITLDCGHSFNINELYKEVVQQKTISNSYSIKIKLNEIKCPYCRITTPKLLPYFKYYNNKLIYGVNNPQHFSIRLYKCEYKGKKDTCCGKNACITNSGLFCNNHIKYTYDEEELIKTLDKNSVACLKKKTIKELKDELKKYSKKTSGNKDELVIRLALTIIVNEKLIVTN